MTLPPGTRVRLTAEAQRKFLHARIILGTVTERRCKLSKGMIYVHRDGQRDPELWAARYWEVYSDYEI